MAIKQRLTNSALKQLLRKARFVKVNDTMCKVTHSRFHSELEAVVMEFRPLLILDDKTPASVMMKELKGAKIVNNTLFTNPLTLGGGSKALEFMELTPIDLIKIGKL